MSARGPLLAIALLFLASAASAGPDPLHQCLSGLDVRIANLGRPRAAEVAYDLEGLKDEAGRLRSRTADYDETRSAVEGERAELDRLMRERDRLLRQIEVDQQAVVNGLKDLEEPVRFHEAKAARQHAAAAAASTPAAIASANAWAAEINNSADVLERQFAELHRAHDEIATRRNAIAQDIIGHGRRFEALERDSGWADMEFSQLMQLCSSLSTRALALLQVRDRPGRAEVRQAPDAIAGHMLKDFGENVAQTGAEHALLRGAASARVFGRAAVAMGMRVPVAGKWKKAAKYGWVAVEVLRDGVRAGISAQELEILNHLYLLGDYADAMRDLVKAEGKVAVGSPEYQAMAQERERMEKLLPHSWAEVVIQSLSSASTYAGGLGAFLAKYTVQPAARGGALITNHLNNMNRQVLGRGVTVGREMLRALSGGAGETIVKAISSGAAEAALRQKKSSVNPEMRQGPVEEMRQGPVEEMRQGPLTEMWPAPSRAQ